MYLKNNALSFQNKNSQTLLNNNGFRTFGELCYNNNC